MFTGFVRIIGAIAIYLIDRAEFTARTVADWGAEAQRALAFYLRSLLLGSIAFTAVIIIGSWLFQSSTFALLLGVFYVPGVAAMLLGRAGMHALLFVWIGDLILSPVRMGFRSAGADPALVLADRRAVLNNPILLKFLLGLIWTITITQLCIVLLVAVPGIWLIPAIPLAVIIGLMVHGMLYLKGFHGYKLVTVPLWVLILVIIVSSIASKSAWLKDEAADMAYSNTLEEREMAEKDAIRKGDLQKQLAEAEEQVGKWTVQVNMSGSTQDDRDKLTEWRFRRLHLQRQLANPIPNESDTETDMRELVNRRRIAELNRQIAALDADIAVLVAKPQPLSAQDTAELTRLTRERQKANAELSALTDPPSGGYGGGSKTAGAATAAVGSNNSTPGASNSPGLISRWRAKTASWMKSSLRAALDSDKEYPVLSALAAGFAIILLGFAVWNIGRIAWNSLARPGLTEEQHAARRKERTEAWWGLAAIVVSFMLLFVAYSAATVAADTEFVTAKVQAGNPAYRGVTPPAPYASAAPAASAPKARAIGKGVLYTRRITAEMLMNNGMFDTRFPVTFDREFMVMVKPSDFDLHVEGEPSYGPNGAVDNPAGVELICPDYNYLVTLTKVMPNDIDEAGMVVKYTSDKLPPLATTLQVGVNIKDPAVRAKLKGGFTVVVSEL